MKINTRELEGAGLNYAVRFAEIGRAPIDYVENRDNFVTCWNKAGPIIERERVAVWWDGVWHAKQDGCQPYEVQDAYKPLIAAMRCYVASKLGDEVDVPDELVSGA